MSDQNQILRLLATIREESNEIRSRQEELYELLISYKDQLQDLKSTVTEMLSGLPQSPYIAGQLVPAPESVEGIQEFRQVLATYLHKYHPNVEWEPEDVVYPPNKVADPSTIELEDGEEGPRSRRRERGGDRSRPRDADLERGPDRNIEPIDLDEPEGDKDSKSKRRRRRRKDKDKDKDRGGDGGKDADEDEAEDAEEGGDRGGDEDGGSEGSKKRRRGRRGRRGRGKAKDRDGDGDGDRDDGDDDADRGGFDGEDDD